ncbi:MAG: hypothetical protein U0936_14080 [Planctomycetaceae bacterium]
MTTKKAVILTIVIVLLAIVVGLALMFAMVDINSSRAEQKAAALGQVTGFVTLIPIFGVWIMWGLQTQKRRSRSNHKLNPNAEAF